MTIQNNDPIPKFLRYLEGDETTVASHQNNIHNQAKSNGSYFELLFFVMFVTFIGLICYFLCHGLPYFYHLFRRWWCRRDLPQNTSVHEDTTRIRRLEIDLRQRAAAQTGTLTARERLRNSLQEERDRNVLLVRGRNPNGSGFTAMSPRDLFAWYDMSALMASTLEGRMGPFGIGGMAPRSYPPEVVDVESSESRRAMLERIIHCQPYSMTNENKSISDKTEENETAQDAPPESVTDDATMQDATETTHTTATTITDNADTPTTDTTDTPTTDTTDTPTTDTTDTPTTDTTAITVTDTTAAEESKIIENNSNHGSIHSDTDLEGTISLSYTAEISSSMCPICLDDFQENDLVNKSKHCTHIFHKECILSWLDRNDICPCCRITMVTREELRNAADAEAWALFVGDSAEEDDGSDPLPMILEDEEFHLFMGESEEDDDEDSLEILTSDSDEFDDVFPHRTR